MASHPTDPEQVNIYARGNYLHRSRFLKVQIYHYKKFTKAESFFLPYCKGKLEGLVLCGWILDLLQQKKGQKWIPVVSDFDMGVLQAEGWKEMVMKHAKDWRRKHGKMEYLLDLEKLKESVAEKSLEEILGKKCCYFGEKCRKEVCPHFHGPEYHLLQISGFAKAWFPTPYLNTYISSVRKGVNTYIYLINIKEKVLYYSQYLYEQWSQPNLLEVSTVIVQNCVEEILAAGGGSEIFAPLENMAIFNWCFPVFPHSYTIPTGGNFHILHGSQPLHCNHLTEPHFHQELPPICPTPLILQ